MENYIEVLSKSSSGNPYTVRFYLREGSVSAFCSCPAGDNRKLCKHVIRIMNGDDSILFDPRQKPLLARILSYLENTDIPLLVSRLIESQILLENVEKDMKKAKKTLEKAILHK
ncbi:MAG TPA: SWIM zinc finger family protein [Sedimentisphaerales bacterium]|nr:SWIM zinc finger family protein [Sedimentisphaerales bacterium]